MKMSRKFLDGGSMFRLRRREPEVSDQLAASWWNENGYVQLQRNLVNPWRIRYFSQVLQLHYGTKLKTKKLLDLGCGVGVLAEDLVPLRCSIYGIDFSQEEIAVADHRAQALDLPVGYQRGSLSRLPFPDEAFDIVTCTDTLEHIADWEAVLSEAHRVLAPDGLFLFSTINRTLKSYFQVILAAEKFPLTRIFPKSTHSWKKFIRPNEIKQVLADCGFEPHEMVGSQFDHSLPYLITQVIKFKNLTISAHEFGKRIQLEPSYSVRLNYMGYAAKVKG
jgi:2-polyprenyl-6-hydroxyphenyl methylase/3-demethylubiquinone-9 3-methyltransferase